MPPKDAKKLLSLAFMARSTQIHASSLYALISHMDFTSMKRTLA